MIAQVNQIFYDITTIELYRVIRLKDKNSAALFFGCGKSCKVERLVLDVSYEEFKLGDCLRMREVKQFIFTHCYYRADYYILSLSPTSVPLNINHLKGMLL